MSYEKNTVMSSFVDNTIEILIDLGMDYKLYVLGEVNGRGCNDDIIKDGEETTRFYPIRKLEYKGFVVLEQMERNSDCDIDDYIKSYRFIAGKEPEDWSLEVFYDNDLGCEVEEKENAE